MVLGLNVLTLFKEINLFISFFCSIFASSKLIITLKNNKRIKMSEKINNISCYNERMKKSLMDKIFFLDKVEANVFVDFGCANSELIKFLNVLFPEYVYIGYDNCIDMIKESHINIAGNLETELPSNIHLFSNWNDLTNFINKEYKDLKKAIILSSVIHEVYSYSTLLDVDSFWEAVFGGTFEYVIVRDMIPSVSINKKSDINDVVKLRKKANKTQLSDYETHWGSITENKNLIHFLLKYKWVENWNREVKENYFPLSLESFMEKIPDNYEIDYYDEFILPYTKRQIMNDFNIEVKDKTHLKCILKRL